MQKTVTTHNYAKWEAVELQICENKAPSQKTCHSQMFITCIIKTMRKKSPEKDLLLVDKEFVYVVLT